MASNVLQDANNSFTWEPISSWDSMSLAEKRIHLHNSHGYRPEANGGGDDDAWVIDSASTERALDDLHAEDHDEGSEGLGPRKHTHPKALTNTQALTDARALGAWVTGSVTMEVKKQAEALGATVDMEADMNGNPMTSTIILHSGMRIRLSVEIVDLTKFPGAAK